MVFSNGIRIVTIPNLCWVVWSRTIKSSTIIYQYPQTYPQVFRRFSQYINDIFHQPCQGCLSQPLLIAASFYRLGGEGRQDFEEAFLQRPTRIWQVNFVGNQQWLRSTPGRVDEKYHWYTGKRTCFFLCDMFVDITDKWCLVDDWGILLTEVFPTVSPAQWCPMYGLAELRSTCHFLKD